LIVSLGGGGSPSSATTSTTQSAADSGVTSTSGATPSTGATHTSTGTNATGTTTSHAPSSKSGRSQKAGKSAEQPRITAALPLAPTSSTSKALGLVEVIAKGSEHAFILAAEHLPPTKGFHYAAWLYNTPTDAYYLGGGTTVGANGTLKAAQGLPPDASRYATIVLTEQREEKPTQPGPIVLSGQFKLEGGASG
jgi:hypothetical protein